MSSGHPGQSAIRLLNNDTADERELIPTEKEPAPKAFEAGYLQSALERKLTAAGVRCGRRAEQQLLPVLAQVNSGTLSGIRCGPFQSLPDDPIELLNVP